MKTVEEALAAIPGRRNVLSQIDLELSHAIRFVEQALSELRIGIPVEITYGTDEGNFVLTFRKHDGRWQILRGVEGSDDSTHDAVLVGEPRHIRAEVFTVPTGSSVSLAPIERLFVSAAETLAEHTSDRSPQLDVARRLVAVLEKAGFVDHVAR